MSNKLLLSWDDVARAVDKIALPERAPDLILAVARGGLVPATMLSHKLGVRRVASVQLESYGDDHARGELRTTFVSDVHLYKNHRVMVVDDVYETGATMRWFHERLPDAWLVAAVMKNANNDVKVDLHAYGVLASRDRWVVFPWEITA